MKNKKVLLRVAFDIKPINGKLPDISRISAVLSTIKKLLKQNSSIFILTWVGRPKGKNPNLSTKFAAQALSKLLKLPVIHISDCIGPQVQKAIKESKPGEIYMLENVRFHKEESQENNDFAKKLSQGYDSCIFDAFPQAHRNTPSTTGIQRYLSTTLGDYTKTEIDNLSPLLKNKKGLTLIIGGAKISDKLNVVKNLINKADNILIGGAAANPLLSLQGIDIKNSLTEKIIKPSWINSPKVHLPTDYLIKNKKILDIGPQTIKQWQEIIKNSKTILWSGPLGLFEDPSFATGTKEIAKAVSSSQAKSIIGGGDTIAAINKLSNPKKFDFISLAGGAMLEFLSGKTLPALKNLIK